MLVELYLDVIVTEIMEEKLWIKRKKNVRVDIDFFSLTEILFININLCN